MTTAATVLARAPLRISLAGGGTDLPSWARNRGGAVLGLAIDQYVAVTVHPRRLDGGIRAATTSTEVVDEVDELRDELVRAALSRFPPKYGVELTSVSDVPAGVGLGGSGAFTVALVAALRHSGGLDTGDPSSLAETASALEMVDAGRPVGKQDHYLSAFGGLQMLHFARTMEVTVRPRRISARFRDFVADRVMLFFTGRKRDAGAVLAKQASLGLRDERAHRSAMEGIAELTTVLDVAIGNGQYDTLGPVLAEHWRLKRGLATGITDPFIDRLCAVAKHNGASGCKIVGAGAGGFILAVAEASREQELRVAMADQGLAELPFGISDRGCRWTVVDA